MEEHPLNLVECNASWSRDILGFRASPGEIFIFLRKDSLKTKEHLRILHHISQMIMKSTRFKDTGTLIMLLLSGSDQIKEAYETVGIRKGDRNFLLAYSSPGDITRFLEEFGNTVSLNEFQLEERNVSYDDTFFPAMVQVILSIT